MDPSVQAILSSPSQPPLSQLSNSSNSSNPSESFVEDLIRATDGYFDAYFGVPWLIQLY